LRDAYERIQATGAEIVAIGTGNQRYARGFVEEERIPFPVLVDDDAVAAKTASVKRGSAWTVLGPKSYGATMRTRLAGYRVHRSGRRVFQLGATFVVGPGDQMRYEHIDVTTVDHAPLEEVFEALSHPGPEGHPRDG
jgi:peroxiredoxin